MSSPMMKKTSAITPRKTMRGHTTSVFGVAHLPGGQHIITCSKDSPLRLWDLKRGAQIGEEWRDEGDEAGIESMALSPNGKTLASGSSDGMVRLWDVEMGKVVLKWKGHTDWVTSVCWSPNGERVVSGSYHGTARLWDVKSGEPVRVQGLNPIKSRHEYVYAVSYSPEAKMIATGGYKKYGIEIWDAKTGKQLTKIELYRSIFSLAWTSDGKKLIAGQTYGSIEIFDTATWQQIAVLDDHTSTVNSLTLFPNNRLLASTSQDKTARLWNLDTNLQVGPPLQHKQDVECVAFSADGKLLSTGCFDKNAYVWNIHAILNIAGLGDLLDKVHASSSEEHISRSSLAISDKSFLKADATGGFGDAYELSPRFFGTTQANAPSSAIPSARAKFSAVLGHFPSLLHRSRHNQTIETRHPPVPSESRLHALLHHLRSLPNTGTEEISELPQPPMISRFRPQVLLGHLSSLFSRPQLHTDETIEPQRSQTPSESRPVALIGRLSSLFRPPPNANEAIELQHSPEPATFSYRSSHVVDVSAMRDREVIYVARRPETASEMAKRVKNPKPWVRVVFFLCCVSPGSDDSPGTNDTPRSS
ncbi:hypothetical protein CY34DRAFT_812241 [Suillus luteus UH-Slu-Lm8-n1]|uniref:WD40 repeat-like protein n=1 Tax=Suillus luteus UH-Slu-Lm8-n1 TaxID=930992 RepID=A0A0D0AB65_9AGAM|nr:hypothetical protein CY34DRAFT_812241 [Suillus luteus UH-Slu-Lm8-n1]